MAVTGMANLAVKVADLDAAVAYYERHGAAVRDRMPWADGERADVFLGPVMLTLFTRAIYEDAVTLPAEGFLHPALFTDDLDAAVAELEAFSIAFVTGEQHQAHGVVRQVWVTDPVGNVVELQQDSEATPALGSDEPIRR